MTTIFRNLLVQNKNIVADRRLFCPKTREHQGILVKNMEMMIKLREEKVKKENAEDILSMHRLCWL